MEADFWSGVAEMCGKVGRKVRILAVEIHHWRVVVHKLRDVGAPTTLLVDRSSGHKKREEWKCERETAGGSPHIDCVGKSDGEKARVTEKEACFEECRTAEFLKTI